MNKNSKIHYFAGLFAMSLVVVGILTENYTLPIALAAPLVLISLASGADEEFCEGWTDYDKEENE